MTEGVAIPSEMLREAISQAVVVGLDGKKDKVLADLIDTILSSRVDQHGYERPKGATRLQQIVQTEIESIAKTLVAKLVAERKVQLEAAITEELERTLFPNLVNAFLARLDEKLKNAW